MFLHLLRGQKLACSVVSLFSQKTYLYIQFYCIKYWKEEKFHALNSQTCFPTFKMCGFAHVFMIQCTTLYHNIQMIHQRFSDKRIAKKLECFKYTIRFMYFQFCRATYLHTSRKHLRYLDLALHHQQNLCGREVNWTETKNGTIRHCHLKFKTKIYFFFRMLHLNNSLNNSL